jgi:hypothetical protein
MKGAALRGSTKPVRENITKWPFFKVDQNRVCQINLPRCVAQI